MTFNIKNPVFSLLLVLVPFFWLTSAHAVLLFDDETAVTISKQLGDYDRMVENHMIRVLLPHSRTFFFLDGATPKGASYEALKAFEAFINEHLDRKLLKVNLLIFPTPRDRLIPMLEQGYGDLAIGNLTITAERLKSVDFSDPLFSGVNEILITHADHPPVTSTTALAGLDIHTRKSSSYFESLRALNQRFRAENIPLIRIIPVNEHLEDEDLLEMVNAGLVSRIVMDSHKAAVWTRVFPHVRQHPDIRFRENGRIAWAFRKNSPQFRQVVNRFVKGHKKGTLFGNILYKKYFTHTGYIRNLYKGEGRRRFEQAAAYFRKYAEKYGFDWLMLAALAFQESGIDQEARSRAGAVGVMQIMPETARSRPVNIPDIHLMEPNIHAGAKYLRHIIDTYFNEPHMDELNKALLSFASYNAGPGRIAGIRKKTAAAGLDPDTWFRNVEILVALKVGREPVTYVSNVFKYYIAYRHILRDDPWE